MMHWGYLIMGAGSGDRVSGCPGQLVAIGNPCEKGRLILEVCVVNLANAFLFFCWFLVVDRPIQCISGWPLALGNRW